MIRTNKTITAGLMVAMLALAAGVANAKDKVKVGFIGPLTGGVSVNGIGGRNSADLAVKLRNADLKAKYEYELVVLDDECKPSVAVQVATKMAAAKTSSPPPLTIVQRRQLRPSTPITSLDFR
jgi:branched-chain amino acid transport system substrate-binding protein